MLKPIFTFFAIITFLFEAAFIFMLTNPRLAPFNSEAIVRVSIFLLVSTVVGVGLLFMRKWAALLFSLFTAVIALWLIIGSVLYVPFAWSLINISLGIPLLFPAAVTIRSWSLLPSGGKWYL
jgi:hypothetical protein